MRILFVYRTDIFRKKKCRNYPSCYVEELRKRGHEVVEVGENHEITRLEDAPNADLLVEMENGRNSKGDLDFLQHSTHLGGIKTAVILIDSHGHPDWHEIVAKSYDHVFFAVWFRRDLFKDHPSAHFLPNATDLRWFDRDLFASKAEPGDDFFDFGFFGSRGGLDRADPMIAVAKEKEWTYRVDQIDIPARRMWPATGDAMYHCFNLFNHQQKHDLNLRIFESMAVGRPLIHSYDPASGIDDLFEKWVHYIPYDAYTYKGLEDAMSFAMNSPGKSEEIAEAAYNLVASSHTVSNRVDRLLEVVNG